MKFTPIALLFVLLNTSAFAFETDSINLLDKPDTFTYKKSETWLTLSPETAALLNNYNGDEANPLSYCAYKAMTIRFGIQPQSSTIYSKIYRSPRFGVGTYFSSFNNKQIGNPVAIYGWLEIPFYKKDKWTLSYYGSFGLSTNFNPYNPATNNNNPFIGSRTNCEVAFFVNASYALSQQWHIGAGVGFRHFSNGSFTLPNLGLNMFPMQATIAYRLSKETDILNSATIPVFQKFDLINITAAVGGKEFDINGRRYYKTTLGINYMRQFSYKYRMGIGTDVFFSSGVANRSPNAKQTIGNSLAAAATLNWEWILLQRLSVPVTLGCYIRRNDFNGEVSPYYERVGVKYLVSKHLTAALTIKAHAGVADFFEWTLGYSMFKDRNRYRG